MFTVESRFCGVFLWISSFYWKYFPLSLGFFFGTFVANYLTEYVWFISGLYILFHWYMWHASITLLLYNFGGSVNPSTQHHFERKSLLNLLSCPRCFYLCTLCVDFFHLFFVSAFKDVATKRALCLVFSVHYCLY